MQVKVRKGDTIAYYSRLFAMPAALIAAEQGNKGIKEGEYVTIPGYFTRTHVVKKGDTLASLSDQCSVPVDMLHLVNQDESRTEGAAWRVPEIHKNLLYHAKKEYTFRECEDDIASLTSAFPFIRSEVIGYSVLQKPIYMLKMGSGPKRIHINAAFHANEWITTCVVMEFLQRYALAAVSDELIGDTNARKLMEEFTLYAVPMVNPDGVDLVLKGIPDHEKWGPFTKELNDESLDFTGWKANIRGVDLNNQFPALWEIEKERKPQNPSPRDYPGHEPLCEPEAKAMAEIAEKYRFDTVIALHTQGEEIYWGFEGREPGESELVVREMERNSGYRAIQYLDSYAGYKDWFIYQYQKAGFTIELGLGVNPIELQQFEKIYGQSVQIFLAAMR